jgi:hypothetical protein
MSSRSEALAARIEEGANGLAAFAQGLSDAEWKTRVPGGSGLDSRPVALQFITSPAFIRSRSTSQKQSAGEIRWM